MSLQLIAGGSGSGKTYRACHELIEASLSNPQKKYFLIVPEQYSMQAQKELVGWHPGKAVLNIDVLSFGRLAYRVFGEVGGNLAPVLDDTGKSLVLQRIALKNKKELTFLGNNIKKPGYIDELKSMLSEFMQYRINAESMDRMIEAAGEASLLRRKLSDVQLIYRQFESYMEHRYITPEEILDILYRVIEHSHLLRDAVILLDGFTGFTPIQEKVIGKLLDLAQEVIVTVTIDPQPKKRSGRDNAGLFDMSCTMISTLKKMAADRQVEVAPTIYLEGGEKSRFAGRPMLDFLEKHLFRRDRMSYAGDDGTIRIYQVDNPTEELQLIAAKIHRLTRTAGCRYRDIAVVTGDLSGYESAIMEAFDAEGIPYFLDRKQAVQMNPFVEFLRAALDLMTQGCSYESVFRYLRTGMSCLSADEIDLLENYVIAFGIRGFKTWNKDFTKNNYRQIWNLEEINRIRAKFLSEIIAFHEAFRAKENTVRSRTEALYRFVVSVNAQEKLVILAEKFKTEGNVAKAREYTQIYGMIMQLFDKTVEVLGDEKISMSDYQQLLEAGFAKVKVGIIPPTVDQVIVGDVERTRLPNIRYLFFAGVNEGIIPGTVSHGGMLTDDERETLLKHHIALAPGVRETMNMQRFYLYLNLTKPSDGLFISFSMAKSDGSKILPSFLIAAMKNLYPELAIERRAEGRQRYLSLETRQQGIGLLTQGLREMVQGVEDPAWRALYRWFASNQQEKGLAEALAKAAFFSKQEDHISRVTARALYGNTLKNSATRLERFAACAFSHFLQYGLCLQEREQYEFRPLEVGNVLHSALEYFANYMEARKLEWSRLTEEQIAGISSICIKHVLAQSGYEILKDRARDQYMQNRMERMLKRSIRTLCRQLEKGDFYPARFEMPFGQTREDILSLGDNGQMLLGGKIDRIDLCKKEDELLVRVIDYKTGRKSFDLSEVYHGLTIQLIVYLRAALSKLQREFPGQKLRPAGVFYYKIQDPILEGSWEQTSSELEEELMKALKLDGLANRDEEIIGHMDRSLGMKTAASSIVIPCSIKKDGTYTAYSKVIKESEFDLLSEFVEKSAIDSGERILQGDTGISPYMLGRQSGCDYCGYRGVCGFDERQNGFSYRVLPRFSDIELFRRMKERCEDGGQLDERTKGSD